MIGGEVMRGNQGGYDLDGLGSMGGRRGEDRERGTDARTAIGRGLALHQSKARPHPPPPRPSTIVSERVYIQRMIRLSTTINPYEICKSSKDPTLTMLRRDPKPLLIQERRDPLHHLPIIRPSRQAVICVREQAEPPSTNVISRKLVKKTGGVGEVDVIVAATVGEEEVYVAETGRVGDRGGVIAIRVFLQDQSMLLSAAHITGVNGEETYLWRRHVSLSIDRVII